MAFLRRILVGLLFATAGAVSIEASEVGPEFPTEQIVGIPFPFRMHVDEISASYRNGEIDEAIAEVPESIRALVTSDRAAGIEALAAFFRTDGGNTGPARDEYHLVKRLHDWITYRVAYDTYLFEDRDGHEGSRDPLEFLSYADGARTTCTGFSALFQMLATAAGIESRTITGRARSYGSYAGAVGNHAWNAVRINDRWYIVDTTADARMHAEGAGRGERGEYEDEWLFVAPEAILVKNWPDAFENQLIDDPISYESFVAMPLVSLGFFEGGLRPAPGAMDGDGLFEGRTRVAVPRGGGNLYEWLEYYQTSDGRYSVELLVPTESFVYAELYGGGAGALLDSMAQAGSLDASVIRDGSAPGPDAPPAGVASGGGGGLLGVSDEQELDYRTLVEYAPYNNEYRRVTITWSLPAVQHGRQFFRGSYRVRPLSLTEPARTAYSFYLRAGSRDGERLPDENVLVRQSGEHHFNVQVGNIKPLEGNAFAVNVHHPPQVVIGARLAAISNVPVERHHFRTHPAPGVTRYVVTPPAAGEYVLRLLAKERNAPVFTHAIALYRFRSSNEGLRHLPFGELDLEPEFHELGLEIVESALTGEEGVYELRVDTPERVQLTGTLSAVGPEGSYLNDSGGERVRPVLHDSVDVGISEDGRRRYHFTFSPGTLGTAHDGFRDVAARPDFAGFVARVFSKQDETYTTVATFYIPAAKNGESPLLPRSGTIARRAALYEFGLSVRSHNATGAADEGYLEVTVDHPADVELASGLYDTSLSSRRSDGEYYTRGNRILSYTQNSWTAYVRPPDDDHYVFRVFARRAGTESYTTVLEIPVNGTEFADAGPITFPPLWRPILALEFAGEGFSLQDVSVSSDDRAKDRELTIVVSAPPGVEMRGLLRDIRGDNLDDRIATEATPAEGSTTYRFTFSLPANSRGEPVAVRIYRYDGEYRLRMSMIVE